MVHSDHYHQLPPLDHDNTLLMANSRYNTEDPMFYFYYTNTISSLIPRYLHEEDEFGALIDGKISRSRTRSSNITPGYEEIGALEPPRAIPFLGMICSMSSVVCFSVASMIVKLLTGLSPLEILGIRSTIQTLFYLSTTIYYGHSLFGVPGHRLDLILRALFGTIAALTIYMSYRLIPLADASTIQFSAPMFVFALGYCVLGERITWVHLSAGLCALVGVVVVTKPRFVLQWFGGGDSLLPEMDDMMANYDQGIILAVIACVSTACGMITLRRLRHTPFQVVVLWFSIATSVSAFTVLYFVDHYDWPANWIEWTWLLVIGLAGIGDQLFMTLAFKYEKVGVVSVSRTMTIVLAFGWDILLFGERVHWTSVMGSGLVILAVVILTIGKVDYDHQRIRGLWHKIFCRRGKSSSDERAKLLRV